MSYLITLADIQALKPISSNVNELKALKPFILEAQEFDVRPFLGDEFWIDLVNDFDASPSLATYSDLFNGSTYVYSGVTYKHEGIKAMLIYYTYSRYLNNAQTSVTPFGVVQKLNDDSQQVPERTLTRLVSQAVSGAKVYEERVKDYIIRNASQYTLYKCISSNKRTGGLRISSVGGNK